MTHFEGISSTEPGVYYLAADSVQAGSSNAAQGSWVSVRRNSDGTFDKGTWVDLNYPNTPESITSSNSVYGYQVVGVVIGPETFAYQATLDIAFQLSNVISGNGGNGIIISGAKGNAIAMNYIGTDPAGSTAPGYGNGLNGILITDASSGNIIGGQAAGINNPTGSKNPANAVFQRPPQGNLISGNLANGISINGSSKGNVLSGNFIGTDAAGTSPLANGKDGVTIDNANDNSLVGCTFYQNPFVFYNVIAGNRGNGLRINNSNNITVQANFLGIGADNATSVPNGGNGLLVAGSSWNTQVGGVIPLGNVISGNALNGIEVRDRVSKILPRQTDSTASLSARRGATTQSAPVLSQATMAMALRFAATPRVCRSRIPPLERTLKSPEQFPTRGPALSSEGPRTTTRLAAFSHRLNRPYLSRAIRSMVLL